MLNEEQKKFRDHIIALSKKIAPQYGIDWRLMAATAVLETGWGKSKLCQDAHNLFGIMATKSTPYAEIYILRADRWDKPKRFCSYQNDEESCHAYGGLLSTSSHYAPAREAAFLAFIEKWAPVYCDDLGYGAKVLRLIRSIETNGTTPAVAETEPKD